MVEQQKEVGRMKLNVIDSLVFQTSEYRGKTYIDIRKYVESPNYTGFTKQGIRFNISLLGEFLENVKKIAESLGIEMGEETEGEPGGDDTNDTQD
jgi:hypothetical protein